MKRSIPHFSIRPVVEKITLSDNKVRIRVSDTCEIIIYVKQIITNRAIAVIYLLFLSSK